MFITGKVMPAPIEVSTAATRNTLSSHVENEKIRYYHVSFGHPFFSSGSGELTTKSFRAVFCSGLSKESFFSLGAVGGGGEGVA